MGKLKMRMELERLMADAERRTGLSEWGGEPLLEKPFRELFGTMVNAIEDEANLHERGRHGAELRLRGMLEARLSLIEERKRRPEIQNENIVRPLFVLGLPRTGSTFLQALLAQDPANYAPVTAEFYFPTPLQLSPADGVDSRQARTREILGAMGMYDHDVAALHPWNENQPEECHYAMELMALSEQLAANWRIPSYNRLRLQKSFTIPSFQTHKVVLQHLQHTRRHERFALKSPGYLLRLPELLATYPDALIVQTHRDPARVIPSMTSFLVALRRASSNDTPRSDKFAQVNLKAFAGALAEVIEFRRKSEYERHFHDALFTDIVRDPIGSVRAIYDKFSLPLSDAAVQGMQAWIDDPANHTPRGRYTLAQYGLDENAIDNSFGNYLAHYAIPRERTGIR